MIVMLTTLVTKINEPQQRHTKVGMQNKTGGHRKIFMAGSEHYLLRNNISSACVSKVNVGCKDEKKLAFNLSCVLTKTNWGGGYRIKISSHHQHQHMQSSDFQQEMEQHPTFEPE